MYNNIITHFDSYKYSQKFQYPPGTEYIYSYIESRGGNHPETVFFGLQAFIKEYLSYPISEYDIDEAEELLLPHGLPFYREDWEYILKEHGGYLPVEIKAVPEGSVVPVKNVLATIVNTDPKCWWLTSPLETPLLRAIWYPTTIATNDRFTKKLILKYLEETGDPEGIAYKLHDFGARGVSSTESAMIGGAAHLINFMGTDTLVALPFLQRYYNCTEVPGHSIPASEHSTITSWGRDNEVNAYRNLIKNYAKPGGMVACVSDSYDIYNACKLWGTELKQDIIDSGATLVVRPDSGEPWKVVLECIEILGAHFGYTVNDKSYKVLKNVRVIQGDGINTKSIEQILEALKSNRWSADNIAFGQGGGLLQDLTRDDQAFAMKCSAARVNGQWRNVYKDPITDPGKVSKKGRMILVDNKTVTTEDPEYMNLEVDDQLEIVFRNGRLIRDQHFDDVRNRAKV